MKYVCLVHVDAEAMGALTEAEAAKLRDDSIDFDWDLRNRGRLILAQPLQAPDTAIVIRMRKGRLSRTDGPYAETKEALGGFFIVEAETLEEAEAMARRSPMAEMGSIEIRPVLVQTHGRSGQGRPEPLA